MHVRTKDAILHVGLAGMPVDALGCARRDAWSDEAFRVLAPRSDPMPRTVRTLAVPWPLLLILVVLALVAWIQGLRAASDRHARLQPERATALVTDGAIVVAEDRFVVVDLGEAPPSRVALYQLLPSRPLIRWIEPAGAATRRHLVVPLDGLVPGDFAVCAVDPSATAGPTEMDHPADELDVHLRFVLRADD